MQFKTYIKKIIPEICIIWYHAFNTWCATIYYGFPAKKMVMIGITGTKGKTMTANFVWSVMRAGGYKTGLIGTANIRIDTEERINPYHMTMPDVWILQKLLKEMYNHGCTHVVLEATSEGMKLKRHLGLYFDVAVFTNLSPEHLPSHNNDFNTYRKAKAALFKSLKKYPKKINDIPVQKICITNADSPDGAFYASFDADKKFTYGIEQGWIRALNIVQLPTGVSFTVNEFPYELSILGSFNIYNALPAIIIGQYVGGMHESDINHGLQSLSNIPGRMEEILLGQPFRVIVDYAHEKLSMNTLLDTIREFKKPTAKIIVLFGAQGGGRDKGKRQWMGYAAGEKADYVILTSDDSYEEDPQHIIDDIAPYVKEKGKQEGTDLFLIVDRRMAIKKAFELARKDDIVLLTGKGAEQFIILGTNHIPWDDRIVAKEELKPYTHTTL